MSGGGFRVKVVNTVATSLDGADTYNKSSRLDVVTCAGAGEQVINIKDGDTAKQVRVGEAIEQVRVGEAIDTSAGRAFFNNAPAQSSCGSER